MAGFPHHYSVAAATRQDGDVTLSTPGVPDLASAPPAEFGGPGDHWSPETLLTAALADCFVLSFKAIARASRLDWSALECRAEGTLDKAAGGVRFTAFSLRAKLTVSETTAQDKAQRLLEKAKQTCFVTQSLNAECTLQTEIVVS